MPMMSMWREEKSADYRWIDRQVSAQYTAGGTAIGIHKYLGPSNNGDPGDATQPIYGSVSETNIQDLLFLENRDRKYDPDVYIMRGIYQRTDTEFNLSQFAFYLQAGTIVMTFHYNDMLATLGRKIMSGDVMELFHLKDDHVIGLAASLKRFYVAGDCAWAGEGFSPLWYPHIWRVKLNPLVDSQEYKGILNTIKLENTSGPMGTDDGNGGTLGDVMSTYQKYMDINEAIIQQAEAEVPKSGYDVSKIYSPNSDAEGNPINAQFTADDNVDTADSLITADSASYSPVLSQNPTGYLTGDGLAPNGLPVTAGVTFPADPNEGDYHLRLDYLPNRLFRFSGSRWVKIEDSVRTNLTAGDPGNETLRNSFANNDATTTLSNGKEIPQRQSLNEALRPPKDY